MKDRLQVHETPSLGIQIASELNWECFQEVKYFFQNVFRFLGLWKSNVFFVVFLCKKTVVLGKCRLRIRSAVVYVSAKLYDVYDVLVGGESGGLVG